MYFTETFDCTQAMQDLQLPGSFNGPNYVDIECWVWGAGGGGTLHTNGRGAGGGYAKGTIQGGVGETIKIVVGYGGNRGGTSSNYGGWGGDAPYGVARGGNGGHGGAPGNYGGGGGGRSAILREDGTLLIAAGGGGGGGAGLSGQTTYAGAGGGSIAQSGVDSWSGGNSFGCGAGDLTCVGYGPSANEQGQDSGSSSGYGGGGGGGGYGGGGAGGSGGSTSGGGGGGNSYTGGASATDNATGARAVPGGTGEALYNYPVGYGGDGTNGSNHLGANHWDGQNGQIIVKYFIDFTTKDPRAIPLACIDPCNVYWKEV